MCPRIKIAGGGAAACPPNSPAQGANHKLRSLSLSLSLSLALSHSLTLPLSLSLAVFLRFREAPHPQPSPTSKSQNPNPNPESINSQPWTPHPTPRITHPTHVPSPPGSSRRGPQHQVVGPNLGTLTLEPQTQRQPQPPFTLESRRLCATWPRQLSL